MTRRYLMSLLLGFLCAVTNAQKEERAEKENSETAEGIKVKSKRIYYGTASYYAEKFVGRQSASGKDYAHGLLTAACNVLPMGTWIRVTNLKNNRSVIVEVSDRMHPRNKRIVDLSKSAAEKLGYIKSGLTQVRVEVLRHQKPASLTGRR